MKKVRKFSCIAILNEREAKESAMMESFCQKFEQGLQKLADGLLRPHGEKIMIKFSCASAALKKKVMESVSITLLIWSLIMKVKMLLH